MSEWLLNDRKAMIFLKQGTWTEWALSAGAFSWCRAHKWGSRFCGLLRQTASLSRFKTSTCTVDSLCDIGGRNQSEQFLPRQKQSEWLSLWNTTYALSSVLETRATTTARLTFRFRIISVNPCLVTCDDAIHEVLIRFCPLKEISGDRRAVLDCEGFAESRRIFRSSVKMAWHVRRNFTHCLSPIYTY